jgi:hypothetical protein
MEVCYMGLLEIITILLSAAFITWSLFFEFAVEKNNDKLTFSDTKKAKSR